MAKLPRMTILLLLALLTAPAPAAAADGPPPTLLSAFFGLDETPVPEGNPLRLACAVEGLLDGMPLVFSAEIDQTTLDPADFEVTTRAGARLMPRCATLSPALEENEDHTVLIMGELGSASLDPPVSVRIVGELRAEDGRSLEGLVSPAIPPYADGPVLVLAETVPLQARELAPSAGQQSCPAAATGTLVRLIWSGGVTQRATEPGLFPPGRGEELGPAQYGRIRVRLGTPSGPLEVHPFYVGDRNDGDNTIDLCLAAAGTPLEVAVEGETVTDPANDWNPPSRIAVTAP